MTTAVDLRDLERTVDAALASGDESRLHVLGYGEITTVLAWPGPEGPYACKRLPLFHDVASFDEYRVAFGSYVTTLRSRGVEVHETDLEHHVLGDGSVTAYCVQPVLPRATLAPVVLRRGDEGLAFEVLGAVVDHIGAVVDARVGFDAQLANWARTDAGYVYLDVSTPFLRDEHGRDAFDCDLFLASLPAAVRAFARRFVIQGVLDTYYDPRSIALDLAGNLSKERLEHLVPLTLDLVRARLGVELTLAEVRRHYRRDARLWAGIQRSRRVDRVWQRRVRRRPYPFLLPGPIDRHL
jgi:Family of unknown function (DUF6206)